MKKIKLLVVSLLFAGSINAQLIDEQNVTITMDLQPILQLYMEGPSNLDFVFDEVYEYLGGITKYGATVLKVSSSVNWDLYAVAYSSQATLIMDNSVTYGVGTGGLTGISCSILELHQDKRAGGVVAAGQLLGEGADYFLPFVANAFAGGAAVANNNVYCSIAPYTKPATTDKYIAGGNLTTATNFVAGGSYLTTGAAAPGTSSYMYSMDYRILPGLPATFPHAFIGGLVPAAHTVVAPSYARPGVYSMNVKYVLAEN